ncbi:MAG: TIGR01777 family oxidoreductase [Thermoleophilaceae bacterium]
MKVMVTGATGVIGRALVKELIARGDEVRALSRDADGARAKLGPAPIVHTWADPVRDPAPVAAVAGADAIVHLLGEPIAQRWSAGAKRAIRDSRVEGTRNLVRAIRDAEPRPAVLVSQSATGLYGPHGDERVDESYPAAEGDFLAGVTEAWEREARAAEELGLRVVTPRTGVVISPSGGALEKMLPPFKLGLGGPIAGGAQYVPWIGLADVVGALIFCLDDSRASGALNLTAPEPVTNRDLSKALGAVLHRPAAVPVPGFAVRTLFGEMGSVVLGGVRAVPARLLELGYRFRDPQLEQALRTATGG